MSTIQPIDVFVSYSALDRERVRPLVEALEQAGLTIWWDTRIAPGAGFDAEIQTALDASRCVLVVWSEHSITSEWVMTEANEGLERGILVPIALDNARPPLAFRRRQTIEIKDPTKADNAVAAAKAVVAGKPVEFKAQDQQSPTSMSRWLGVTALVVGAIFGALAMYSASSPSESVPRSAPVVRVPLELDGWDDWERGYPTSSMVISADGETVVFVARDSEGASSLKVRQLNQLGSFELPGTQGAEIPFLSPDGRWVGYFNGHIMKRVALDGGEPITITTLKLDSVGASWGTDNRITFAEGRSGLKTVSVSTGDIQTLSQLDRTRSEGSHRLPHHIVGEDLLLFTILREKPLRDEVWVLNLTTNERHYLFDGLSPAYVSSGHIVYAKRNSLWVVPFDVTTMKVTGPPQTIQGATAGRDGNAYGVARSGPLVYLPDQGDSEGTLVVMGENGESTTLDQRPYFEHPRFSNDGESLVVSVGQDGEMSIWVYDIQSRAAQRFSTPGQFPLWSPDDQSITFMERGVGLVRQRLDKSTPPETLIQHDAMIFPQAWTNQGQTLFYAKIQSENEGALFTLDPGSEPRQLEWPGPGGYPSVTNDEQWVAICDFPDDGIFVARFPNIGATFDGPATGCTPRWGPDNKQLYYQNFDKLWAVDVEIAKGISFGKREMIADLGDPNPFSHFDVDKNGRIVFARHEHLAPKPPVLMMNWTNILE